MLFRPNWSFIRDTAERIAAARLMEERPHAHVAVMRRIQGRWLTEELRLFEEFQREYRERAA